MCFAQQRRALFRHLDIQKCSDPGVLYTFWLGNVLRATTACTFFRHLNFQSGLRPPVFYTSYFETCFAPQRRATFHLSSAPAALASLLFDPPESQTIGKTQCFATLLPFRVPESSFFSLFLFSDLLSSALLFSDSSSVRIVGSLTSKHLFDHIWSRFSCVTTSLLPFVFLHFCLMWRCDFPDSEHVQN